MLTSGVGDIHGLVFNTSEVYIYFLRVSLLRTQRLLLRSVVSRSLSETYREVTVDSFPKWKVGLINERGSEFGETEIY